MPLYNFNATDSGGDWEADLLEEERRQQVRLHVDVSWHFTDLFSQQMSYYMQNIHL